MQLLVDRSEAGRLEEAPPPADQDVLGRQALAQIREFWRCIALLPAVIGRDERLVGFSGLAVELNLVAELLLLPTGTVSDRGVQHLKAYLPAETRELLEQGVSLSDLSPQTLVGAHLELARIVREVGPGIVQRYGFAYPQAREVAALGYAQRELEALDHDLWGRQGAGDIL